MRASRRLRREPGSPPGRRRGGVESPRYPVGDRSELASRRKCHAESCEPSRNCTRIGRDQDRHRWPARVERIPSGPAGGNVCTNRPDTKLQSACPVTPTSVLAIREASIQITDHFHREASSASAHAGVHCGTIGAERLVLLVQGAKMVQSELPSGTSLCRLPPGPARSLRSVPGEPRPHDPPGRRECWACSGGDSLATGRRPGSGDVRFDTGVRAMVEPGRLGLCDTCPLGVQLPRHGSAARRVDHGHGRAAAPARLEPGHRDSTTASGPVIATRRLNDPVNGVIHTRQNGPPKRSREQSRRALVLDNSRMDR